MIESSINNFSVDNKSSYQVIQEIVDRIAGENFKLDLTVVPQDPHLAENQLDTVKCGDNGIFRGVKVSEEERVLSRLAKYIDSNIISSDGKYLINDDYITICQSGVDCTELLAKVLDQLKDYDYLITINPLGSWSADLNNDTGVTGRKVGSDLGRGATGGAICGKDLSKADVSINIFLYLLCNKFNTLCYYASAKLLNSLKKIGKNNCLYGIEATCNIGDKDVLIGGELISFEDIIDVVRRYILIDIGGFEKLAEWGLV